MSKLKKSNKRSAGFRNDPVLASNLYDDGEKIPNLDDELQSLRKTDKPLPADDTKQLILAAGPSKPYTRHKDDILNDFITCLALAPKQKWANLLVEREVLLPNGETCSVPHIISMLSGFKTAQKLAIANLALIDWNSVMKKKRISGPNSKFPWYQPITQNQRNRSFFALMSKKFLWQMTLEEFDGERMLAPFLEGLYKQRYKKYKSVGYAQEVKKRRLTLNNRKKISLAMFDERDPEQHQMKVLFGCGAMFGFRGSAEHTLLELGHIRKGTFLPGHPWEGKTYYGFGGFEHKTHKLSLKHSFIPDDDEHMRVPYIPDDPENLGGAIHRLIPKFTRGQSRFYCKLFTPNQKKRYVSDGGDKKHEFQPNTHLGKTMIAKLFKKGAAILGLEDPDQFYPHSLRAMFITSLANDPAMNQQEIMASARHSSFTSSASYMVSDGQSETCKFNALGMNIDSLKKQKVESGLSGDCKFI